MSKYIYIYVIFVHLVHFCLSIRHHINIFCGFGFFFLFFGSSAARSTTHPKFDSTGVRTHDLQIMAVHFYVTERPALTTWLSVTPHFRQCSNNG